MKKSRSISLDLKPGILFLILNVFLFLTFHVQGQKGKPDSVIFYSRGSLDSLLATPVSPERIWRLLGKSKENASYLVVMRTRAGDVEIHEQWDDVAIVRSGSGILRTGYQVKGQKESGNEPAREWLGGVIQDERERKVSPGDFIVIPAMLAHQYVPNSGEVLTYWTIKVRRPKIGNH